MKKTIYKKFDKSAIGSLPLARFEGRIVTVVSETEASKAVDFLLSQSIIGIDTETKPAFKRGVVHQVALLQVSTHDLCFLFRLNHLGLSPSIVRLLTDKTVLKVGLSLHDDLNMLHKRGDFQTGTFIDLQDIVKKIGIEDMSLQKLYANLFGRRISKSQQLSNWQADVLSDRQKLYAATDAWACIIIYEELMRLIESREYDLCETKEPQQDEQKDS
ncbi:MAG: 3'-5' exonuclease [Prevotella sp.]